MLKVNLELWEPASLAGALHQSRYPFLSVVEQPSKEPTAAVSAIIAIIATTVATLVIVAAWVWIAPLRERRGLSRKEGRAGRGCPLRHGRTRLVCGAPLDDLVEFTPTQPAPPAVGAVVDLDILPLGHNKIDSAYRAEKVLLRAAILVSHLILSSI